MTPELALMEHMTAEQREKFESQLGAVRKKPRTALLLSIFGLSRFYLGEADIGILQWVLAFFYIGILWMFVDIFTAMARADDFNAIAASSIAAAVGYGLSKPTPKPEGTRNNKDTATFAAGS
jgi:TM2 domain-containing membrane protein YozV